MFFRTPDRSPFIQKPTRDFISSNYLEYVFNITEESYCIAVINRYVPRPLTCSLELNNSLLKHYTGSFTRTVTFNFFGFLDRKLQIMIKPSAKFLYVYDILILSFENNQKNIFRKN